MTKYRYIEDYKSLGFGLFIHYGLYSLLGKGEWSRAHWHIPKEEYEALAGKFTAENWIRTNGRRWQNARA